MLVIGWGEGEPRGGKKVYLGFPGGSVVKNLPAMQETPVQSLGREDPLEEVIVTHFRIRA